MKKLLLVTIAFVLTFACATAAAEPSASPSSTPALPSPSQTAGVSPSPTSPAATPELIVYKSIGETVVRIQMRLRDLGYFNFKPTGNFQTMTVDATIKFQQRQLDANGQSIIADGTVGPQSMGLLFSAAAARAEIVANIPVGPSLQGTPTVVGELTDWGQVKTMLVKGQSYTVTDFNTGSQFRLTYTGGENHAEMECSSATDTTVLKEVFGNDFSFFKRPAVISINGKNIAASLQGSPHGEDTVSSNDMDGHLCMFFNGSTSHVSNLPDAEHVAQIYKAAGRDG
ncbi:MAG TPA: peptidoglycan-binding protein [Clostridia bacterium]|nr:peptidoglycan-binding protein [Clostridia bacterium]